MESQLFGHKAGSFTGADRDHIGFFQQADMGTLFLDEVGEMTLEGQAKLLRILEGHPFLPRRRDEEVSVDVRVIAATNQDLPKYVRERTIPRRPVLSPQRVRALHPPLRERGERHRPAGRLSSSTFPPPARPAELGLDRRARAKLLAYQWPGNVRQLRNVIDSAVVMAEGKYDSAPTTWPSATSAAASELETLRIDYWERKLIAEALNRTGGNVPEAAKLLGIGRATLYRKIEEYGIDRK